MSHGSHVAARLSGARACTALCAALLPLALAARLPEALDGQDAVNFALALVDFDPLLEQPHFPGYPLYVALCRLLLALGLPEAAALALPGVLAATALVPALAVVARRCGATERVVALAALLLATQPLVLVEAPRPMPDLLATSLVWSTLALAACARAGAAGFALGLALGVRVDVAGFAAAALLLDGGARARFAAGLAAALALWLPPFALALPPGALRRGAEFATGHFTVWGSTAFAGAGGATPGALARGVWLGVGGPVLLALALLGAARAPDGLRRAALVALGPYSAWLLLGQNLASPRHFLPLAPALAGFAAAGLAAAGARRARAVFALLALAAALPGFALALGGARDGRALAARVAALCRDCGAVFAGASERLLERYPPAGPLVYRRADLAQVRRDLAAWPELSGPVGITSELAGSAALGAEALELTGGLYLYRIEAEALR